MNQLKFSLGPFELFAAIIGGIPLLLAAFLLYQPVDGLQDLMPVIKGSASWAIAPPVLFASYVLGGTFQGITWRYFTLLCKLFNQSYLYFGDMFEAKSKQLPSELSSISPGLSFEDRLVLLVREKIGIPAQLSWLDTRLTAYLQEYEKQTILSNAERHLATHIMYRTWSFGFCWLSVVLTLNLFRSTATTLELWLLPVGALLFAYLTFFQSLQFKRWNNRTLLLGFYFAASEQGVKSKMK